MPGVAAQVRVEQLLDDAAGRWLSWIERSPDRRIKLRVLSAYHSGAGATARDAAKILARFKMNYGAELVTANEAGVVWVAAPGDDL